MLPFFVQCFADQFVGRGYRNRCHLGAQAGQNAITFFFSICSGRCNDVLSFGIGPVGVWVILLLIYAYIASTLPVQTLLQPRDYINSHQLFVALFLLAVGILVAHPTMVAPAVNLSPEGAPPIWPMASASTLEN